MIVERFSCGRARSNAYLVAPRGGPEAFIVDAGATAAPRIAKRAHALGLRPEALLVTHGHPDHVWTARRLAEMLDIPVHLHRADWVWLRRPLTGGQIPIALDAMAARVARLRPARLEALEPGTRIELAGSPVRVVHTPGHTPGSVCLLADDLCFSGDTLFAGAVGHWAYPGGSREALQDSLRVLLQLDDAVRVLPGHGGETSVGAERELLVLKSKTLSRRGRAGG